MPTMLANEIEVTRFGEEKVLMDAGPDDMCACVCSCRTQDVKVANNQYNFAAIGAAAPQP